MQETRQALHRWMSVVMRERGWSAAAWARRAAVTPTNVTRFLRDPDRASLPGADTIGRLALAAGSEPRFLDALPAGIVKHVPLLTVAQIRELSGLAADDAADFLSKVLRDGGGSVLVDRVPSPRAFAVAVNSDHLNAGGVIHDDEIVVEPLDLAAPRPGDLAVSIDGDSVCVHRWYPPYLVPVSTERDCAPRRCDEAVVVGIAMHIVRRLRF
jgi:hypothetical protein